MQDEVYEDEIEFDDPPIDDEIPSDELDNVAVASSPTSIKHVVGRLYIGKNTFHFETVLLSLTPL